MLAIPAMYVVGRELGGTPLGLVAAALCAWSKWPTLGARRGLTFAWAVFPAALFLAAILRYMRRGDRRSALSAGFWLGLGQYGYNAFKIVPAMVPLAFGLCLLDRRWKRHRGRLVRDGLLVAATSLLVFLPLLQYMLQRPQDFWYRAMTRAGSQERPLPGPPAELFAKNLGRMALAFHWRGDEAWINTPTEEPFLDPVTGAFLLAGIVVAGVCVVRGSTRWALVLVSLFVLTLASTLALAFPVENPGINRAAVAIPSVLVLAGLPAAWLLAARAGTRPRRARGHRDACSPPSAPLSLQQNYESYFVRFRDEQTKILEPTLDLVRVMREYREKRGVPFDNAYLLNTDELDRRPLHRLRDRRPALVRAPRRPARGARALHRRPAAPLLRPPERPRPAGAARAAVSERRGEAGRRSLSRTGATTRTSSRADARASCRADAPETERPARRPAVRALEGRANQFASDSPRALAMKIAIWRAGHGVVGTVEGAPPQPPVIPDATRASMYWNAKSVVGTSLNVAAPGAGLTSRT